MDSTTDSKRVTLSYPDDWDGLSDEEKDAVCLSMAQELRKGLGRT